MEDLLIRDVDLQRFADEGEGAGQEDGLDVNQGQDAGQEETKTYSQEDIDKAVSEATKGYVSQEKVEEIIAKTIAKERQKAEKEAEEAKRLSKLSAEERAKEEAEANKEEIERLTAEINRRDLEAETIDVLNQEGLKLDFKEFVIADTAEDTFAKIKRFKPLFEHAVQEALKDRMAGKTPRRGGDTHKLSPIEEKMRKYERK